MSSTLDHLMKGLSIEFRQKMFSYLKHDISSITIKWLLEKPEGYPSYHACGFTDEQIEIICDSYAERFARANQMMAEVGRPPLFSDPRDSYRCALEYVALMEPQCDSTPGA